MTPQLGLGNLHKVNDEQIDIPGKICNESRRTGLIAQMFTGQLKINHFPWINYELAMPLLCLMISSGTQKELGGFPGLLLTKSGPLPSPHSCVLTGVVCFERKSTARDGRDCQEALRVPAHSCRFWSKTQRRNITPLLKKMRLYRKEVLQFGEGLPMCPCCSNWVVC